MRSNLAKFRLLRSLRTTCGRCESLLVVLLRNGTLSSSNRARGPHKLPLRSEREDTQAHMQGGQSHLQISICKKTIAGVGKRGEKKHDVAVVLSTSNSELAFAQRI